MRPQAWAWLLGAALPGCGLVAEWAEPGDRLAFPLRPVRVDPDLGRHYDVDGDGRVDFAFLPGPSGLLERLCYDDDQDGAFDRERRTTDHAAMAVPHVVLLVDSIPYRLARPYWEQGGLRWFHAPAKVIAPFPSMSVVIFNDLLGAPPMPAAVERYLDPGRNEVVNLFVGRAFGHQHGWHHRLDWYLDNYMHVGGTYLRPESWLRYELFAAKRAADGARHAVTLSYISASSGIAVARAADGIARALDLLDALCVQLLYEREGAVRISLVSDHGHNLTPTVRFDPEAVLAEAGFEPVDRGIDWDREVFVELDGLVSYFGVQTSRPRDAAGALLARPELELAIYAEGAAVVVRDALGAACVEERGGRVRYRPLDRDVLGYAEVIGDLRARGAMDAEGYASDRDWLLATADHPWPDAPRRLWDAFHRVTRYPCRLMCTLRDGHHAGIESFERFVDMNSTHGGLSQFHSDAVLFTMVPGISGPLRSRDVLPLIEPRYDPAVLRR